MSPELFISRVLMPLAMAALMFGLGTTLTRGDFTRVLRRPRAAAVGLACQVALVPLIGALVAGAGLPPLFAVGLMIVAACPGGLLSNLVTWFARGDSALSISLTAVTSCLSLLTLPLWLTWATGHFAGEAATVSPARGASPCWPGAGGPRIARPPCGVPHQVEGELDTAQGILEGALVHNELVSVLSTSAELALRHGRSDRARADLEAAQAALQGPADSPSGQRLAALRARLDGAG